MPRVLHVKDATGAPIERGLVEACRNREKNIKWLLETTAVDLLTLSHDSVDPSDRYHPPVVIGAHLLERKSGAVTPHLARETILATGGLGQVYLHTTNPPGARGDGFAMARRAGARLLNLEYIQFHPTALVHARGRLLLTEALRGEGARITDAGGPAFLSDVHPPASSRPATSSPARSTSGCWRRTSRTPSSTSRTRSRSGSERGSRTSCSRCLELGFDLTAGPVPVVPAAHYACGGVAVDSNGRTTLGHLRAVGEVSCTGVHGANRLASTSLLEGLLWGWRAGKAAAREADRGATALLPEVRPWQPENEPVDPALIAQDWMVIRHTMWNYVGLLRSETPPRPRRQNPRRAPGGDRELLPPRARCPTRCWVCATASRRPSPSTARRRTTGCRKGQPLPRGRIVLATFS